MNIPKPFGRQREERLAHKLQLGRRVAIRGAVVAAIVCGGAAAALATDSSSANVYRAA